MKVALLFVLFTALASAAAGCYVSSPYARHRGPGAIIVVHEHHAARR